MKVTKTLAAMFCLLFLSVSANAVESGGAVTRRMDFLNTQLSLDADQTQKLEQIIASLSRQNGAARSAMREPDSEKGERTPDAGAMAAQIQEQAGKAQASVRAILDEKQTAQYEKLIESEREWWLDPQLLQMDSVLDLSLDQCRQIFPVLRRSRLRMRALRENARETRDAGAVTQLRKETRESDEAVLEFLDENQQELWKQHIEAREKGMEQMRSRRPRGMRGRRSGMGGGPGGMGG